MSDHRYELRSYLWKGEPFLAIYCAGSTIAPIDRTYVRTPALSEPPRHLVEEGVDACDRPGWSVQLDAPYPGAIRNSKLHLS
jgi:hypothetical protein